MSAEPDGKAPTIRIVKKKVSGGGHHGGAWKVAYADFVTAMMAFFMVMWIISMDQPVKEKIQDYFNNPFSSSRSKAGISKMASGGKSPISIGVGIGLNAKNWRDLAMELQKDRFVETQQHLNAEIGKRPALSKIKDQVGIRVTHEGLTIELIEAQRSQFFERGSARLPAATVAVLQVIGKELKKLPNPCWIEGHTDRVPYGSGATYTNWELSADRANAARRVLEASGMRPDQVVQVRGYAASRLRRPDRPEDPSNRRVTIVVMFQTDSKTEEAPKDAATDKPMEIAEKFPAPVDLRPKIADAH